MCWELLCWQLLCIFANAGCRVVLCKDTGIITLGWAHQVKEHLVLFILARSHNAMHHRRYGLYNSCDCRSNSDYSCVWLEPRIWAKSYSTSANHFGQTFHLYVVCALYLLQYCHEGGYSKFTIMAPFIVDGVFYGFSAFLFISLFHRQDWSTYSWDNKIKVGSIN